MVHFRSKDVAVFFSLEWLPLTNYLKSNMISINMKCSSYSIGDHIKVSESSPPNEYWKFINATNAAIYNFLVFLRYIKHFTSNVGKVCLYHYFNIIHFEWEEQRKIYSSRYFSYFTLIGDRLLIMFVHLGFYCTVQKKT